MPERYGLRRKPCLLLFLLSVLMLSMLLMLTGNWAVIKAAQLSPQYHTNENAPMSVGTVTEYPIPTQGSQPVGITSGPDGNL